MARYGKEWGLGGKKCNINTDMKMRKFKGFLKKLILQEWGFELGTLGTWVLFFQFKNFIYNFNIYRYNIVNQYITSTTDIHDYMKYLEHESHVLPTRLWDIIKYKCMNLITINAKVPLFMLKVFFLNYPTNFD